MSSSTGWSLESLDDISESHQLDIERLEENSRRRPERDKKPVVRFGDFEKVTTRVYCISDEPMQVNDPYLDYLLYEEECEGDEYELFHECEEFEMYDDIQDSAPLSPAECDDRPLCRSLVDVKPFRNLTVISFAPGVILRLGCCVYDFNHEVLALLASIPFPTGFMFHLPSLLLPRQRKPAPSSKARSLDKKPGRLRIQDSSLRSGMPLRSRYPTTATSAVVAQALFNLSRPPALTERCMSTERAQRPIEDASRTSRLWKLLPRCLRRQ